MAVQLFKQVTKNSLIFLFCSFCSGKDLENFNLTVTGIVQRKLVWEKN
jgi:hypothetical protein